MATQTHYFAQTALPARRYEEARQSRVLGMDANKLAKGLGWFSIGLGLAELLAPHVIARLAGTRNHRGLIRGYGIRELGSGIAILTRPRSAALLWSRVTGDVVDLASLGAVLGSPRSNSGAAIGSMAAVAGVTVLDVLCAREMSGDEPSGRRTSRAEANVIVNRSPEECYGFWRDLENLPRFMSNLQSVRITGDNRSHWVARLPGDRHVEWDAEIEQDSPNERIAWRSTPGSSVYNSGSVEFERAPGGRGTIVRVQMDYGHPAQAAAVLATLVGKSPEQMVYKELRRFKQVIETGEAITTEGQPAGRSSGATWLDSIAR